MSYLTRIHTSFRLNRLQRYLLFAAATFWFLAAVVAVRRNYQDSWILEDLVWPFAGFMLVFLLNLHWEDDNRLVALLCAWAALVLALVPSLKYIQVYGETIDAVIHYLMTNTLITTGRISSQVQTYEAVAGMHSWLASMGLTSGLSAAEMIKFGIPLMAGIIPVLLYWICSRTRMPAGLTKYVLGVSFLAIFPYHLLTGTGFTLIPLLLFLGVLLVSEYYSDTASERVTYSLLAILVLVQLTLWHTTTPLLLLVLLVFIAFTPLLVRLATGQRRKGSIAQHFIQIGVLAAVLILGYHSVEIDPVFRIGVTRIYQFIMAERASTEVLPASLFSIPLLDAARIFLLMYGREAILYLLAAIGLVTLWRNRARFNSLLALYSFLTLVILAFAAAFPLSILGIDYGRFMWVPTTIAPFFAGFTLWWWSQKLQALHVVRRRLFRGISIVLVCASVGVFALEFYAYQPLVPPSRTLADGSSDEHIVWLVQANTAYQDRMIHFAEAYSSADTQFNIDVAGNRQYLRYFGNYGKRGLYLPLEPKMKWEDSQDAAKHKLYLLHWPGEAGGYFESVSQRSVANLTQLRDTVGWGLVYDNGESFVLQLR